MAVACALAWFRSEQASQVFGVGRREGDGYVAGDIKSGSGEEGQDDDAKLKKYYGVQLALYTDILERRAALLLQPG